MRSRQKAGKAAKFGSYRYSAVELYEKRECRLVKVRSHADKVLTILPPHDPDVLLPAEQTSPRQFEKLSVILSSNEVGIFTLEIVTPSEQVVGSCEIKMEDLLQAKFENNTTLNMFDQVARVKVNTLIFLINKSKFSDRLLSMLAPVIDPTICAWCRVLRVKAVLDDSFSR